MSRLITTDECQLITRRWIEHTRWRSFWYGWVFGVGCAVSPMLLYYFGG